MAITGYNATRVGTTTIVTVVSDLTGVIYYHWYLDGSWMGRTTAPRFSFSLAVGEQARVVVVDTNDAAFDPIAGAPENHPARRTLWWTRSLAADVVNYRVEQNRASAGWTTLGEVRDEADRWDYAFLTGRLDDLVVYQWRVVPVDAAGNDGTAITLDAETIVRPPEAPNFTVTFGPGWNRTIAAA